MRGGRGKGEGGRGGGGGRGEPHPRSSPCKCARFLSRDLIKTWAKDVSVVEATDESFGYERAEPTVRSTPLPRDGRASTRREQRESAAVLRAELSYARPL